MQAFLDHYWFLKSRKFWAFIGAVLTVLLTAAPQDPYPIANVINAIVGLTVGYIATVAAEDIARERATSLALAAQIAAEATAKQALAIEAAAKLTAEAAIEAAARLAESKAPLIVTVPLATVPVALK